MSISSHQKAWDSRQKQMHEHPSPCLTTDQELLLYCFLWISYNLYGTRRDRISCGLLSWWIITFWTYWGQIFSWLNQHSFNEDSIATLIYSSQGSKSWYTPQISTWRNFNLWMQAGAKKHAYQKKEGYLSYSNWSALICEIPMGIHCGCTYTRRAWDWTFFSSNVHQSRPACYASL